MSRLWTRAFWGRGGSARGPFIIFLNWIAAPGLTVLAILLASPTPASAAGPAPSPSERQSAPAPAPGPDRSPAANEGTPDSGRASSPPDTEPASRGAASSPAPSSPDGLPPAGRGSFRIVAPRAIEILSGSQPIEVALPASIAVGPPSTVQISVDGMVVARLEAPPYRTVFDFGTALTPRRIDARVVSGPGEGLTASITTRGFDTRSINQVARVDLVTLYVSVRTAGGKYITNLDQEAFRIIDNGQRQTLTYFGVERRPLAAAILLDTSFSMRGDPIAAARDAATRFVKTLAPGDRVMVMSFSDSPRLLQDLTTDRDAAVAAIASVEARGGTALYDAIYAASERLSREEGRKTIILLSDGRDEAQNGIEPGSLHTFEEALEKALRSETILFTIGLGRRLEEERDFYGRLSLKEILDRLALDSGGTSNFPQRSSQLKGAYELIGEELRNQYSLGYSPVPLRPDGQWHTIKVELQEPGLTPFTRRGYYAPKG